MERGNITVAMNEQVTSHLSAVQATGERSAITLQVLRHR